MVRSVLTLVVGLALAFGVLIAVQSIGTSYIEPTSTGVEQVTTGNAAKANWNAPCWRIETFKYGAHNHWKGPYPYLQHRYINHGWIGNGYLVEWQTWVRPKWNPWGWKYANGDFKVMCK